MASPRTRRLKTDYELLSRRFANWPLIQISASAGLPPEHYRFVYSLKGLYVDAAGEILERDSHALEVNLSLEYPRRAPQCRMLTRSFTPTLTTPLYVSAIFGRRLRGWTTLSYGSAE
jgi:ubiquitin-protein ligase